MILQKYSLYDRKADLETRNLNQTHVMVVAKYTGGKKPNKKKNCPFKD